MLPLAYLAPNLLTYFATTELFRTFLGSPAFDPKDPEAFPGLATDKHKHFPPTYIAACGADPLRDDGLIMAKMLEKAGVSVKSKVYEGLPHYFWANPLFPLSQHFMTDLFSAMQWIIGKM